MHVDAVAQGLELIGDRGQIRLRVTGPDQLLGAEHELHWSRREPNGRARSTFPGRRTRIEWRVMPGVSVCLSFDFDAMSVWINPFRARDMSTISRGEFGA